MRAGTSLQALTLKLYGDNLLTPSANVWITFSRALILGMAITEALSWGYVGKLLVPGSWLAALLAGLVIFFFVWGVDASLMSLDRNERQKPKKKMLSSGHSDRDQAGVETDDSGPSDALVSPAKDRRENTFNASEGWSNFLLRIFGGGAVRLLLVVGSLVITAPFVALIVFEKDIDKEIERDYSGKIAERTKEIQARVDTQIKARLGRQTELQQELDGLSELLKTREREFNDEMRSPETRGYGPIAQKLEAQVKDVRQRLQKKQSEISESAASVKNLLPAESEFNEFIAAIQGKNYDLLSDRWGINADPNSFKVRNKIIATHFEGTPEYKKAETAIRAFLGFLFLGLVVMKIYEPRSTKIYFNAALQADWIRYQARAFDAYLRSDEKSVAMPNSMTPFRFEEFITGELPELLQLTAAQLAEARAQQEFVEGQQALQELLKNQADEVARQEQVRNALGTVETEISATKAALLHLEEDRAALMGHNLELERRKRELRERIDADSSDEYVDIAANILKGIDGKQKDIAAQMSNLNSRHGEVISQLEAQERRRAILSKQAQDLAARLGEIGQLQALEMRNLAQQIRRKFGE